MRTKKDRAPAARCQLHVVSGRRHGLVGNRVQSGGTAILPAIGAEHAGHAACPIERDSANAGMRMRRAHHHGMRLARQREVIGEAAPAGEETEILFPHQRASNRASLCACVRHAPTLILVDSFAGYPQARPASPRILFNGDVRFRDPFFLFFNITL